MVEKNVKNQEFTLDYAIKQDEWTRTGWWSTYVTELLLEMECEDGDTLLDIGCNLGGLIAQAKMMYPNMHFCGLDVNPKTLRSARERVPYADFRQVSSEPLPFPPNYFKAVTIVHTLGHTPNPFWTLQNAIAMTEPGGTIAVLGPNESFYRWMWWYNKLFTGYQGDPTIQHTFTPNDMLDLFTAVCKDVELVSLKEHGDKVWWLKHVPVPAPKMLMTMILRKLC